MGGAKREMERLEEGKAVACGLLVDAGAIEECEVHEGTFIDQMDDDAVERARQAGLKLIADGEFDGDASDLDRAIDAAMSDAGSECYSCEKNFRDD